MCPEAKPPKIATQKQTFTRRQVSASSSIKVKANQKGDTPWWRPKYFFEPFFDNFFPTPDGDHRFFLAALLHTTLCINKEVAWEGAEGWPGIGYYCNVLHFCTTTLQGFARFHRPWPPILDPPLPKGCGLFDYAKEHSLKNSLEPFQQGTRKERTLGNTMASKQLCGKSGRDEFILLFFAGTLCPSP